MSNQSVHKILSKIQDIRFITLGDDNDQDISFINDLYCNEIVPIFEHSYYHVLSYLKYKNALFAVEGIFGKLILVQRDSGFFIFTPKIKDYNLFSGFVYKLIESSGKNIIEIQNISSHWLENFKAKINLRSVKLLKVRIRSQNEAVYDVKLLNQLPGKDFSSLRQARNRLLISGKLRFRPINKNNIDSAINLLKLWQETQGRKYEKNKFEKEKFVYRTFADLSPKSPSFVFELGILGEFPVSICAMYKIPGKDEWATTYIIKGINRKEDRGMHGVSDATYIYCFQKAKEMGVKYINDGEIGNEVGTREHKLRFQPIKFFQSYDVFLGI